MSVKFLQKERYAIVEARPGILCTMGTNEFKIIDLDASSIDIVLKARPGYERTMRYYLNRGHHGVGAIVDGELAALAWYFVNEGSRRVRIKGYFPLESGDSYLHADWTAEAHRGRGLHKALIQARVKAIMVRFPESRMFANMSITNSVSFRNYISLGFRDVGNIDVWQVGGRPLFSSTTGSSQ